MTLFKCDVPRPTDLARLGCYILIGQPGRVQHTNVTASGYYQCSLTAAASAVVVPASCQSVTENERKTLTK